jgi:large subunit ribosomal protein L30
LAKIKVKQIKSLIGCTQVQRRTVEALGLKKINHVKEHEDTPQIRGMIHRVSHLVKVEE